jgi:hypothetical protein
MFMMNREANRFQKIVRQWLEASADDRVNNLGKLTTTFGQAVKIVLTRTARLNQPTVPQQGQVMAHRGLTLRSKIGAKLGHIPFLLAKQHQDLQACRVRDLLKQLRDTTGLRETTTRGGRRRLR